MLVHLKSFLIRYLEFLSYLSQKLSVNISFTDGFRFANYSKISSAIDRRLINLTLKISKFRIHTRVFFVKTLLTKVKTHTSHEFFPLHSVFIHEISINFRSNAGECAGLKMNIRRTNGAA